MKLTFLGTGTSQGVPVIGCRCPVCRSADPRDRRLRTAAMVEIAVEAGETVGKPEGPEAPGTPEKFGEPGTEKRCSRRAYGPPQHDVAGDLVRLVIDAGPDFRYQMLRTGVRHIDAILLTHEHKDHIGGLDDVRAFNFVDYPIIHRIPIYGTARTLEVVRRDFSYAFATDKYRGVPELELCELDPAQPFRVRGVEIVPVSGHHSPRFEVTGYRIGKLAYLTDFKAIEPQEVDKLRGVDTLVVNALRREAHDSHFSLGEALALIREVKPRAAYLTHHSHEMGRYAELEPSLPDGVHSAYDTLQVEIK